MKRIIYILVVAVMLGILYGYMKYEYLDLENKCFIQVKEKFLKGNKHTIISALKEIKEKDPNGYGLICKNISTIYEEYCYKGQEYPSRMLVSTETDGCYIKNTNYIFITPEKETSQQVISKRADAIIRYASLSEKYLGQTTQ